jgi:hypothetical protein
VVGVGVGCRRFGPSMGLLGIKLPTSQRCTERSRTRPDLYGWEGQIDAQIGAVAGVRQQGAYQTRAHGRKNGFSTGFGTTVGDCRAAQMKNPWFPRGFRVCPTGVEPVTFCSGGGRPGTTKPYKPKPVAPYQDSGCTTGCTNSTDPDLSRLVASWPTLTDPIRAAMLALLQSATATPKNASLAGSKRKR